MADDSAPRRKKHYLPGKVYRSPGTYFVTVCTRNRAETLGQVHEGGIQLSRLGEIVEARWLAIPQHHSRVRLDLHVVMPNHLHGLITLLPPEPRNPASIEAGAKTESLMEIITAFKASATRYARLEGICGGDSLWQRQFWDHVLRHEGALEMIRNYIIHNPLAWHMDKENAGRTSLNEFYAWIDWYTVKVSELQHTSQ